MHGTPELRWMEIPSNHHIVILCVWSMGIYQTNLGRQHLYSKSGTASVTSEDEADVAI